MEQAEIKTEVIMRREYRISSLKTNERGVALVVALVMLVLLTILAAWALNTSSTNLKIAGNYTKQMDAFYAAEAGMGFAASDSNLKSLCEAKDCSSNPTGTEVRSLPTQTYWIGSGNVFANQAAIQTEFLFRGQPPFGFGEDNSVSADQNGAGQALFFLVTSTGLGPGNSRFTIEAEVVQIPN